MSQLGCLIMFCELIVIGAIFLIHYFHVGFLHQLLLSSAPVCLPLHISLLESFHNCLFSVSCKYLTTWSSDMKIMNWI